MGQYYSPVNIETLEYLYSHDYDNGLKLMEHSYIENNFMNVIENLLSPEGNWYKAPIVWAGDYADEARFLPAQAEEHVLRNYNLYEYSNNQGTNIKPSIGSDENEEIDNMQEKDTTLRFICNWTTKQFVDLDECPGSSFDMYVHPLSLLTCDGNGRGGGDFRGANRYTGAWAGHRISMERYVPAGFARLKPDFKE